MIELPRSILIDTNIWLDYYDPNRSGSDKAFELLGFCCKRGIELYYTATAMKDVFFILQGSQKRAVREESGGLSEGQAAAINAYAWGAIKNMYEIAAPIPIASPVIFSATKMRDVYSDLEDDIVMAAAKISKVDYLATNDNGLIRRSIVPTLSCEDMLVYLQSLDPME